ncbi:MAG: hypothetical protein ACYCU7_10640 [Acidimicrobiales bacterium]
MPEPYTSTACRIGQHRECRERRVVPDCGCPCHDVDDDGGDRRSAQ